MPSPTAPDPPEPSLIATTQLLRRAKEGDRAALDALMERYLPRLQAWATGRLPGRARSLLDTGDLVQETLLSTFARLDRVEVRGPGGFQAYVRSAVLNRIRDAVRWSDRRPGPDGSPETIESPQPSPLELAIGADLLARYDRALATLTEDEQQLLHLKIELDYDYEEIALMDGRPNAEAARGAVRRALRRLAEAMGHHA